MLPNLLLAGPPKCGTSSLFDWLCRQPKVQGTTPKETFMLMDKGNPLNRGDGGWRVQGDVSFSHVVPHCPAGSVAMDGTTHHMFQRTARDYARTHEQVRALFVLRDPVARLRSSFAFSSHNLAVVSRKWSFDRFVKTLLDGDPLPADFCVRSGSDYVLQRDLRYGEYERYLSEWEAAIGRERMYIICFERLMAQSADVLRDLCAWLGIECPPADDRRLDRKNPTYAVAMPRLQRVARRLGPAVPSGVLKDTLKGAYLAAQGAAAVDYRSQTEDDAALKALAAHYAPYNQALHERFGVDISQWSRP